MNSKIFLLTFVCFLPMPVMALNIAQTPLDINQGGTPLVMLDMERDHKLYYEAYNDASDIDKDFVLDTHYKPSIKYFGYFDSHKCYSYSTTNKKFSPTSNTTNKQCTNAWSGDFLNYLTTSRMDAIRRVLYGGKRSTDTSTATVLERAYIPQDAHSWGKEYTSTAVDGYDISLFTPLSQPVSGKRHLFANTSLLCPSGNSDPGCTNNPAGTPLLRVLTDTNYRVWEWLSIERPVAGVQCATGNNSRANCVPSSTSGFTAWEIVPAANFANLKQATWRKTGSGTNCADHPNNAAEFNTMETCALAKTQYGEGNVTQINGSGNPFSAASGSQDDYFTLFTGNLVIPAGEAGNYKIAVDGDDAVEVFIDGNLIVGWYGGHGNCNTCLDSHSATVNLSAGTHTIKFRHEERGGGDNYYLYWQRPVSNNTAMNDLVVRVDACVAGLLEPECRGYPKDSPTVYKPAGILQQFGEPDRMAFGLITGSYMKNVSGGVLRKNISSLKNEIDVNTGQFTAVTGIIKSIDALKIVGFGGSYSYNQNCGVPEVGGPLAEGRCRMWGNPTAEIMYEGLRYFAGKTSPTSGYTYTDSGSDDNSLGLPIPAWQDPYRTTTGGYPACSKPSQLVFGDINPNFDTDQLPGRSSYTTYNPPAFSGDLAGIDVSALADTIWGTEYGSSRNFFIGQSEANTGNKYDGAPTAKQATSFATIRGLSPEEPTQQGGYYAGSVGLFGKTNDLNPVVGEQKTDTFSVVLASPLPRFAIPVNGKTLAIVPFAKTVGGCGGVSAAQGSYQPTNTIVDFYVDTVANTGVADADAGVNGGRPYAKFRINFEDSEYGSDHDMDAIAEYELKANADNTLSVRVSSNYAAGGCIQHMGYVISGTTADGIYLEVRDPDTSSDVDYYLDTPNTANQPLPTDTTRTFSTGTISSAAFVAHDPLWYAAKWGGFIDANGNNKLDGAEWDMRNGNDGVPDSYFLVTNAGELKKQLDSTFTEILDRDSSGSAAAATSSTLDTKSRVYRARFNSLDWSGQLLSYKFVNGDISISPEWDAGAKVNSQNPLTGRTIITKGATDGVPFTWGSLTGSGTTPPPAGTQQALLNTNVANTTDNCGAERVAYLRGDKTNEAPSGNFTCASGTTIVKFRERKSSVLGDIVSSSPLFVGAPNAGFSDADNPGYSAFRAAKLSRKPVIYAGANDGMLHGFDASIDFTTSDPSGVATATSGNEVLGYVPSAVYPNLSKLTDQNYNSNHQFFVDDSPMSADVNLGSATSPDWRTVLVSSMGAGGKGFFALDITDPASFSEAGAAPANTLLWEFTEADMGFAFNRPAINFLSGQSKQFVRIKVNGVTKWAVVVGNGYNSPNGKAVLYVIFIEQGIDGTWSAGDYKKIIASASAAVGFDNGLSTPQPMDTNSDGFVDTVYAGDLKGNMWKFLIGEVLDAGGSPKNGVTSDPSTWQVAFSSSTCGDINPPTKTVSNCVPLFVAKNASNQIQPIFWPPELAFHKIKGQLVYFGTGKYIEATDSANNEVQTFYAIWDKDDGTTVGSRTVDLLKQEFSATACADPDNVPIDQACTESNSTGVFRIPTARPITWRNPGPTDPTPPAANCTPVATCGPTHLGWYIDTLAAKERITGIPKVISNIVFFNTLIPPDSTCSPATGFLVALDFESGGLFKNVIFNTNGNTKINSSDFRAAGVQISASIGGSTIVKVNGAESSQSTSGQVGSGYPGGGVVVGEGEDDRTNAQHIEAFGGGGMATDVNSGRLNWRELFTQ